MLAWTVLFIGVAATFPAASLVRLAGEAAPLVIGAYRLSIASAVVVPLGLLRGSRARLALSKQDAGLLLLSGVCLALHFAFWITSLSYTSVASSVVLVTTTPLMLALVPRRWRGDSITWRSVAGIAVALVGTAVIAYADAGYAEGALLGDGLALLGAAAMAGHWLLGRSLLVRTPLQVYVAITYPMAAVVLLAGAVAVSAPLTGFSGQTYGAILLLALLPQLVGHSSANWALRRLSAAAVSTAFMAEPVGAAIVAVLLLGELPPVGVVVGGAAVLVGISLVVRGERAAPPRTVQRGGNAP